MQNLTSRERLLPIAATVAFVAAVVSLALGIAGITAPVPTSVATVGLVLVAAALVVLVKVNRPYIAAENEDPDIEVESDDTTEENDR